MPRLLIAIVAGALVLSGWSAAFWMTVGSGAVGVLADEAPVTDAIREHVPGPGAYYFPGFPVGEISAEQQRDFAERHRRGPVGMLVVHEPGGGESPEPSALAQGLALALLTSALIALVLRAAAASSGFAGGAAVALLLALAASLGTHARTWNQFHLPGRYSAFLMADVAGGWLLAGLVIAAILPRRRERLA